MPAQFGFASWPRLKAHLELLADYARSPHHELVGGPLADEAEIVDEFPEELPQAERFVVAEVSDGLIVRMCAYATEQEARDHLLDQTRARPARNE